MCIEAQNNTGIINFIYMFRHRLVANLVLVAHLAWMILVTIAIIVSFWFPAAKLFALALLGLTLGSWFFLEGCPLTWWENRARKIVNRQFDVSRSFISRIFKVDLSFGTQRAILGAVFLFVLIFA